MSATTQTSLLDYPCDYVFKAFGAVEPEGSFLQSVLSVVRNIIPVPLDAVKSRVSSGGNYLCVSIVVRLENEEQRSRIYVALQGVDGLKFLL